MSRPLHPDLTAEEREDLLFRGADDFNAGRFFEAHEAWEEIWRSTDPEPADLFRGLIQVAVGLYHYHERGKPAPARRVLARGLRRVEAYEQGTESLDLDALCAAASRWEEWLAAPGGEPPPLPKVRFLEG
ncbi:MAG: DUF309 domain-containing protein [Thermoanaerobaculia bacterium]|nr:DUF309 domain-containing protein [Thermoanaerobaculia bacterium]